MTSISTNERPQTPQGAPASPARTPIRVRKIGHVVYEVSDLDRAVNFWTQVMGFAFSDRNERGMVFLRCAHDHHTVALMKGEGAASARTGLQMNHFAMEVDSLETLFEAREFLRASGIPVVFEGRRGPGCNIGVEFLDPDGYMLEIYWGMDQIGDDGRTRPPEQFRRASSLEEAVANPVPDAW